ncbi:MAG: sulfate ABC transporter substrate-binding protein [Acidobacteria bacterium]|nr:sulfate ABC transporter substrate-binding protein [Acidobacteriota bacterium]
MSIQKIIVSTVVLLLFFESSACRRPKDAAALDTITVYAFSVMKEPLEKDIFPAFQKEWASHTGQQVKFSASFAGSEMVTNQIISGVPADVAIVAIERNARRLRTFGATKTDWHAFPYEGIINQSPIVIVVRKGNPKKIKDFPDLAQPGIKLIHPDPISSGGAQWSLLAIYCSELVKSEKETGKRDEQKAYNLLFGVWKNVIATPESARQARTQFESGFGDALITYELEALQMKDRKTPVEIIIPRATIFTDHTIVMIDRRMPQAKRELVDAFIKYLWSEEAQKAFVKHHFRGITDEMMNDVEAKFGKVELPFTVEDFGGWQNAYPQIIENVWKYKVQAMR